MTSEMEAEPYLDDEQSVLLGAGRTEELTREEKRRHRRRIRRQSSTVWSKQTACRNKAARYV